MFHDSCEVRRLAYTIVNEFLWICVSRTGVTNHQNILRKKISVPKRTNFYICGQGYRKGIKYFKVHIPGTTKSSLEFRDIFNFTALLSLIKLNTFEEDIRVVNHTLPVLPKQFFYFPHLVILVFLTAYS